MRLDAPAAASPAARLPLIDAARGFAVAAMIVYHFSWDLRYFGFITADVGGRSRLAHLRAAHRRQLHLRLRRQPRPRHAERAASRPLRHAARDPRRCGGSHHARHMVRVPGQLHLLRHPAPHRAGERARPRLHPRSAADRDRRGGPLLRAFPPLLAGPAFDHPALIWLGLGILFPAHQRLRAGVPVVRRRAGRHRGRAACPGDCRPLPACSRNPPRTANGFRGRFSGWAGTALPSISCTSRSSWDSSTLAAQVAPPDLLGFEPSFVESCAASCVESGVGSRTLQADLRMPGRTARKSKASGATSCARR